MITRKRIAVALAGCVLAGGVAGSVSAQSWREDRDRYDRYDRYDRDRDYDRWRDRDWDRDRRRSWRDDDRHCYYVRRRIVEPDGDIVIRRTRVCED